MSETVKVLFHADCADGFGAAWLGQTDYPRWTKRKPPSWCISGKVRVLNTGNTISGKKVINDDYK